jgi:hypothetical protein
VWITNPRTMTKYLILKSWRNKVRSTKLKNKLYMMRDCCRKRATCNSATNTREIWKNLCWNTALTIIARGDMPIDTARVMCSGCRRLMSRVGRLKGEDSFSLKWDLLLKIVSNLILKRNSTQVLTKNIRNSLRKIIIILQKVLIAWKKMNSQKMKL